jgi:hypothetical protein
MGPPFVIVIMIFIMFRALFAGIALVIMLLVAKLMKARIRAKRILITAAVFFVLFFASSLVPRERRDGVTVTFFGGDWPTYIGQETTYGLPLAWTSTFNTYDNATKPISLIPHGFYIQAFLIDFVLWTVVSAISVNALVMIKNKSRTSRTPETD